MSDIPAFEDPELYGDDPSLIQPAQDQSEHTELSELSKVGYRHLKENRSAEAVACFLSILQKDPENHYALVGLGDASRKSGAFQEAIDHYRHCLALHPGNNYAIFGLADCFKALNHYQKAIEIWEQYLAKDSTNITVLTRVADASRKIRDFRKSKALYMRVLSLEADNPYALIGLGHLHYDFKEYREALSFWGRIVELHDGNADIRVLTAIGNCYRKLKQFEHGIRFFEQALVMEPDNFYALFGLADCYRGVGHQEKSLINWNRILELDPKNKVILTRAGDAYRSMGRFDLAVEYYSRALSIDFDMYALLGLAIIDRIQGRYSEAITALRRLIHEDPKNHRFYLELAQCHVATGDRAAAITTLQQYQHLGIRNPSIHDALTRLQRPVR